MAEAKHPYVVVFPRGQLTTKDKERLTKGGVIAVEADQPDAVVQISLRAPLSLDSELITGDLIVTSLLQALAKFKAEDDYGKITSTGRSCHEFVRLLASAIAPKP